MPSERVVVLLKTYLGDAVMATPLIDGLNLASKEVFVHTSDPVVAMLEAPFRSFGQVPWIQSKSLADSVKTAREIRKIKPNLAIVVNRSLRSAFIAKLARIPIRVGHATEKRGALLTRRLAYDPQRSEVESYLDLARAVGMDLPWIEPKLYASESERDAGRSQLQNAVIGVQPGASYSSKRIPPAVLADAVRELADISPVALIGGKDEVQIGREFEALVGRPVVNLIGRTGIRGTLGILANLRVTIGPDTGVMHVAAAVGCPTVTVFGPKPASKWGHLYAPHQIVQAEEGDMSKVTAESILEAAKRALSRP